MAIELNQKLFQHHKTIILRGFFRVHNCSYLIVIHKWMNATTLQWLSDDTGRFLLLVEIECHTCLQMVMPQVQMSHLSFLLAYPNSSVNCERVIYGNDYNKVHSLLLVIVRSVATYTLSKSCLQLLAEMEDLGLLDIWRLLFLHDVFIGTPVMCMCNKVPDYKVVTMTFFHLHCIRCWYWTEMTL